MDYKHIVESIREINSLEQLKSWINTNGGDVDDLDGFLITAIKGLLTSASVVRDAVAGDAFEWYTIDKSGDKVQIGDKYRCSKTETHIVEGLGADVVFAAGVKGSIANRITRVPDTWNDIYAEVKDGKLDLESFQARVQKLTEVE